MRIKRFEAPDTKSALEMVKAEMGDNAVILANKTITVGRGGGGVKRYGKKYVEIVAAMDYDLDELTASLPDDSASADGPGESVAGKGYGYHTLRRQPEKITASASQPVSSHKPASSVRTSFGSQTASGAVRSRSFSPETISITAPADDTVAGEISFEAHDLRKRFSGMLKNRSAAVGSGAPAAFKAPLRMPPPAGKRRPKAEHVAEWRDRLIDQVQFKTLAVPCDSGTPMVLALVGATGVGKTTTAAKLAAWYSLREGRRVALLSMDCYRIGATDQLRTYARIMGIPCEVVLRKRDLGQAIARHADKDLILIDTAGKSPYDEGHVAELGDWFAPYDFIEPYLTVSATTKKEDLTKVIEAYQSLAVRGLILTKLDETRAYATLCQQVVSSSIPVACLCTGQRVPEDFLMASKNFLENLFKRGWESIREDLEVAAEQMQCA